MFIASNFHTMLFHSLTLHTSNFPAVTDFYQNKLGLSLIGAGQFQAGASNFVFKANPAVQAGSYHFAFNIPCNQVREAIQWLENRGITLVQDSKGNTLIDFPRWNAEACYFFDSDGNIVEFIARRDLQNETDEPFGPESLLSISEVGIVTGNVLAWNKWVARYFNIQPFEKSAPGPNFSALGTDSGLFIVVPEGRKWFLTDLPATQAPMELIFENQKGEQFTYKTPE